MKVQIAIRLDRTPVSSVKEPEKIPPQHLWEFKDDTGADVMIIYRDDLYRLMPAFEQKIRDTPMAQLLGYGIIESANGTRNISRMIAVQVNLYGIDDNRNLKLLNPEWHSIPCAVQDRDRFLPYQSEPLYRLNGPWMRSAFYVYQAPEYQGRMYVSNDKDKVAQVVPTVDQKSIKLPFINRHFAARWYHDPMTQQWFPAADISQLSEFPHWIPRERSRLPLNNPPKSPRESICNP